MKFRRKLKIFPKVRLNISKSGVSTSLGIRGANATLGAKGAYINYGIPGTGIYDRTKISPDTNSYNEYRSFDRSSNFINNNKSDASHNSLYEEIVIASGNVENIISSNLAVLRETLYDCYKERDSIEIEIAKVENQVFFASFLNIIAKMLILGFYIKWFGLNFREKKCYLKDLRSQLENCYVDIDITIDDKQKDIYIKLQNSFIELCNSDKIWSINSYYNIDKIRERSVAEIMVKRQIASFSNNDNLDIIKSSINPLLLTNSINSLYIYPAFILIIGENKSFGMIEIKDINLLFNEDHYIEYEDIPLDSKIMHYVWDKSNKDGSPDRRFNNNYQIPVCQYGRLDFQNEQGLNESFQISNFVAARKFANCFNQYNNQNRLL